MLKRALAIAAVIAAAAILYAAVPPPQRAAAQFVDQGTWGGNSGGSANAQTIAIGNYTAHKAGVILRFNPGFTNTGPTQVNVSGLGLVNVMRPSSIGLVAFSGGEFFANEPTSIMYNGSVYVLASNVDMTPIGKTIEFRGTAAPRGSLIEDGSCVSQTTYAALFSVISTTYGSCSAGLFKLPFSNGTAFVALDNQGVNGAANRITNAGSGCTATAVGTFCGAQNSTLNTNNLPPYSPSGTLTIQAATRTFSTAAASDSNTVSVGNTGGTLVSPNAIPFAGINSFAGTPQGGTSVPFSNIPPILTGIRAIKY